jgi:hypothetical protein
MVEGLVITKEKSLFEEFNINFSSERNNFEYADSADSAREIIGLEIPDFLVIIEKSAKKTHDLLTDLFENIEINKIPVLCYISSDEWSQRDILWKIDVKDIIQLPISKEELHFQLERFISDVSEITFDQTEAGMHGKLEDYNLLDLIQTLEANKKTGILVLYRYREEGKIWFHKGNIHDAKYKTFKPLIAILKLVSWMDGDFSITFVDDEYGKIIEEDNKQILLDAIQYIDQRHKILDSLPDRNETLLISPEADMDRMDDKAFTYLRFFHGGNTISAYLESFDQDDLTLLGEMRKFVEEKLLMTRQEFDSHITEQELQAEGAGIKKAFKRFFTRKDDVDGVTVKKKSAQETNDQDEDEIITETGLKKFNILFEKESLDLKKFKDRIEKL